MLHGALDELQRGGGCQYVVDQGFKVKRPMRRPQSGPPMLRVEKLDREENTIVFAETECGQIIFWIIFL